MTTEPIPGWDQPNVLTYEDVLGGHRQIGEHVLILDEQGDRVSPGLAELLAERGFSVEIMTRWPNVSHQWLGYFNETGWVYARLDQLGVKVTPNSWISAISGTEFRCFNVFSRRGWRQDADTVVLVTSKYSNNDLYTVLKASGHTAVHHIGDAVAPRTMPHAKGSDSHTCSES